ncbi:MAG: CBS domain-containing protein [Proteobacteria bacterium]|nr:CBS domain-containing protein [Pseudomonadota bacterium]
MLLREIMKRELVTVEPAASIKEAAERMKSGDVGCTLITENGVLRGILTDRDITCNVVAEGKDPDAIKVKEIMNKDIIFTSPETDTLEASRMMAQKKIRRLPVQSNGRLEGLVTMSELAPILREEMDNFFNLEEAYRH